MSIYVDRDIQSSFNGDLVVDQKGDLKLANALDTYKSIANFILRTDNGDYSPDPSVGSNLGSFVGEKNTRDTHSHMEFSITKSIAGIVFSVADINVKVLPLDIDEAVCLVFLAGTFLIDGELTYVQEDRLAYSFPYIDADITPLTI